MRVVLAAVVGLIGGFFLGMVIDQVIGVLGFLASDGPLHFRGLPLVLAAVGAGSGAFLASRARSG